MKTKLSDDLGMLADAIESEKTLKETVQEEIDQRLVYQSYTEQQLLSILLVEMKAQTQLLNRLYQIIKEAGDGK